MSEKESVSENQPEEEVASKKDRMDDYADMAHEKLGGLFDRVLENLGLGGVDKKMVITFSATIVLLLLFLLGPIKMILVVFASSIAALAASNELVPLIKRMTGQSQDGEIKSQPSESSDSKSE